MPYALITNGNFNTGAAAVPAPFTLTRVGDVADVDPNSHLPVEVSAFSAAWTGYIDYNTLTTPHLLQKWLEDSFGDDYLVYKIRQAISVIDAYLDSIAPPLATAAEKQQIFRLLRLIPGMFGNIPTQAMIEYDSSLRLEVDFAGTPAGATLNVVEDVDGEAFARLWDWGDDSVSIGTQTSHVYAVDGTYDVTLTVIGGGGIKSITKSFVINVP